MDQAFVPLYSVDRACSCGQRARGDVRNLRHGRDGRGAVRRNAGAHGAASRASRPGRRRPYRGRSRRARVPAPGDHRLAGGDPAAVRRARGRARGVQRGDLQPPTPAPRADGSRPSLSDGAPMPRSFRISTRSAARSSCRHLDGMFAVAVWDARRQRLVLVRDRIGEKPLYYAITTSGLWFASQAEKPARRRRGQGARLGRDCLLSARRLDPRAGERVGRRRRAPPGWPAGPRRRADAARPLLECGPAAGRPGARESISTPRRASCALRSSDR